jgi:hypothetical protein
MQVYNLVNNYIKIIYMLDLSYVLLSLNSCCYYMYIVYKFVFLLLTSLYLLPLIQQVAYINLFINLTKQ